MKRFWLVLLLLGLIAAFSTQALAVDVKVSGEYYAAGMYLDKTTLKKGTATDGPSTAFYYQRLRVRTDFVLTKGLYLVTRADIMERAWGGPRSAAGTPEVVGGMSTSAGTRAENENIAIDWVYLAYWSPIGVFTAGYGEDNVWGTVFGNSSIPVGKLSYYYMNGGLSLGLVTTKNNENSRTAVNSASTTADADNDAYNVFAKYAWKTGEAGLLVKYWNYASNRPSTYRTNMYGAFPYAKAQLGPVAVQTELGYIGGKSPRFEDPSVSQDVTLQNLSVFLDATANFGNVYVGGTFVYVSGDDPGTTDKSEGGVLTGGLDYNPCLIMWNFDRTYWAGSLPGHASGSTTAQNNTMSNTYFFQARAGVKPIDKLDILASFSYATADKKPTSAWLYNDYGYEVDLTATYKITNNLSYMLGAGYLFTGKYYKADNDNNQLNNDFMVVNKLTLTF